MDLGSIKFNPNHKIEAAARDAATGTRLVLLGLFASICSIALAFATSEGHVPGNVASIAIIALLLVSVLGVYGAYLTANALDWPSVATAAIVLGAFVPYLKFVVWIVLLAFSFRLIRAAGYKLSLFGPLQRRALA